MTYHEWVRRHLKDMLLSHGFKFTPRTEIDQRLDRLRTAMPNRGFEGVLVIQKMDLFYLSGTAQDGILYVPVQGAPLLMIRREVERARVESALERIVPFQSLRDLPRLIQDHGASVPAAPASMGLEMDLLPARDYFRLMEIFPGVQFADASGLIRTLRQVKSPWEIALMRRAGEIGARVFREILPCVREGMTEIEIGGLMEATAKRYGHEGLLRVRSMNYEAYTWHILSGPSGGIVSQSDSPMGGLGLSPAFPVGAGLRVLKSNEPVLVDFGTCYHGYQADETRMLSIGKMPGKFVNAFRACREIHDAVLDQTRPGADCGSLFERSVRLARKLGYADSYLGPPGLQTRFVAHGIGLELGEPPFLAAGHSYPLEQGMTFAVEPKIVFPGEGAVGLENTVLVTDSGHEILTPLEQDVLEV